MYSPRLVFAQDGGSRQNIVFLGIMIDAEAGVLKLRMKMKQRTVKECEGRKATAVYRPLMCMLCGSAWEVLVIDLTKAVKSMELQLD